MDHKLFKSRNFEEGKHSVVGNCNNYTMEERWQKETPIFARAINSHLIEKDCVVLDYGCGVGRIAKELLGFNQIVSVIGLDDSSDQLKLAKEYVNDNRFVTALPEELDQKVDLVYCIYVLQHIPAIYIREALQRIHYYLKDGGKLIYCSSDYRMAVRFDQGGFFDDRFLGVNLHEEIERFFKPVEKLFSPDHPDEIIRRMIFGEGGGLQHPAMVYEKKKIESPLFNAGKSKTTTIENVIQSVNKSSKKLILRNRLSPGDILVMTAAIRSLHMAHPGVYQTDVDTPCNTIFEHSPYITNLNGDGQIIDMQYPEIHKSGASGRHFSDGHRKYLEERLGIVIPQTGLLPDLFLTQDEKLWPSPLIKLSDFSGSYWVINAGSKGDYTLKQYHRWQEVVDLLSMDNIQCVQIGVEEHNHTPLRGVIDLRGKTKNHRELYRLIYKSDGVLTCVSYPMHIAAALRKPCVVVAGAREGTRWELYPDQRYLYMNGAMSCGSYDGCWKSKTEECQKLTKTDKGIAPLCLELTRPEDVVRAVQLYYLGGAIAVEVLHV